MIKAGQRGHEYSNEQSANIPYW